MTELTPEVARQLFSPRDLNEPPPEPPEPPVEGLPPKDKPFADYTDAERQAGHAQFERTMREKAKRDEREQREAQQRIDAEAKRTAAERHGDAFVAMLAPGAKQAANAALIRSVTARRSRQAPERPEGPRGVNSLSLSPWPPRTVRDGEGRNLHRLKRRPPRWLAAK